MWVVVILTILNNHPIHQVKTGAFEDYATCRAVAAGYNEQGPGYQIAAQCMPEPRK